MARKRVQPRRSKSRPKDEVRIERTISFQDMCAYARVLARKGRIPDSEWEIGSQFSIEYQRELGRVVLAGIEDAFDSCQEYVTSAEAEPDIRLLAKSKQHLTQTISRLELLLKVVNSTSPEDDLLDEEEDQDRDVTEEDDDDWADEEEEDPDEEEEEEEEEVHSPPKPLW